MMSKTQIDGARAIVTGASSGIGREIARTLADRGARLVVTARREKRLREFAAGVVDNDSRVEVVAGDITDPATRQQAIRSAESRFGGLDILVNSAGIGAQGLFEDATPDRLRQIMEVNFFALVELTRLAIPLLKQGASPLIVNISSIFGHRGVPFSSEYCASKFAVQGFSEALRAELSRHRVGLLVVSPGTTETEFAEHVIESTAKPTWRKPRAVSAAAVARQTVQAICRRRHEIIPHRTARILYWMNRLSPWFVNHVMTRFALRR